VKQQLLFDAIIAVLERQEIREPSLVTRHSIAEQRKLGLRILLAEDNPINQKLAVILLQKAGYSVDAVDNGAQVLKKVQDSLYSAILMDVQMPEMDGLEATRQIREMEKATSWHIPIIAMTAHAMPGDRERCLEAGMDDYVSKPLEPKVLFNVLERWVRSGEENIVEAGQDYSSPMEIFPADLGEGLFGESQPTASPATKAPAPFFKEVPRAAAEPVNLEAALHRFEGDRDFLMAMLKEYKDHLPGRLGEIREAAQDADASRLSRLAHNLKGVSLNFNADAVADIALRLEELGKREDLTDALVLVAQLDAEVHRLEEYLASYGL
jgi:CheY-like chemotaxis protein